jgi:hypothetical protein
MNQVLRDTSNTKNENKQEKVFSFMESYDQINTVLSKPKLLTPQYQKLPSDAILSSKETQYSSFNCDPHVKHGLQFEHFR